MARLFPFKYTYQNIPASKIASRIIWCRMRASSNPVNVWDSLNGATFQHVTDTHDVKIPNPVGKWTRTSEIMAENGTKYFAVSVNETRNAKW